MSEVKKSHKKFEIILYCILGVFAGIIFLYIFFHWQDLPEEFKTKDKPFYLVNVVIALAAIATAIFTWWKNTISKEQVDVAQGQMEEQIKQTTNAQRQIQLQEDIRLDSLFAKAVELLKEENDLITRKGGVHILKDLAITSPIHTQKCIDVLCSINGTWMPFVLKRNETFFSDNEIDWINNHIDNLILIKKGADNPEDSFLPNRIMLSQDVNRALSFILKHISTMEKFNDRYDLSNKYLCSINLKEFSFEKFIIDNTIFVGAEIHHCNFNNLEMNKTNFKYSNLEYSSFIGCNLNSVNFEEAILFRTQMSLASMYNVNFVNSKAMFTIFQSVFFTECGFKGAEIRMGKFQLSQINECNFEGARLSESNFEASEINDCNYLGANLFSAYFLGAKIKQTSFVASNLDSARFEGAKIINCNFELSVLYDCILYGSKIVLSDKYFIFGDNSFKPIASIYNDDFQSFKEKIEMLTKTYIIENSQVSFMEKMLDSFVIFNENQNTDFSVFFNSISTENQEILAKRIDLGLGDKFVALSLLNFITDDPLIRRENALLKDLLSKKRPLWWNEFISKHLTSNLTDSTN